MFTQEDFTQRLKEDAPIPCGLSALLNPRVCAAMVDTGFEMIILDLEHGNETDDVIARCVSTISNANAFVAMKAGSAQRDGLQRALSFAPHAIYVPHIETGEEAAAMVALVAELVADKDQIPALIPMIESMVGVDNVEAIALTPGITGIVTGSGDLGRELGTGSDPVVPELFAIFERVLTAANHADIVCGVGGAGASEEQFAQLREHGNKLPMAMIDLAVVMQGAQAAAVRARS